ncbi:unnamed protein product [Echinostoma caproni]|uniref:Secreted protein n=1 Tax=Echinostoma caproni TaxID=27848 RepID=A0A183AAP5_9TREM|nr:unnamed protein product [Echinostoma caproni]
MLPCLQIAATFLVIILICSDGNIIPYDSDMDIFVLAADEQKIRRLATERVNITKGQFNLVTRPGPYCTLNPGERMNCKGQKVPSMQDTCSFCGPLARMFMDYGNYIDMFLINIELHTDSSGVPIQLGYVIEEEARLGLLELPILLPQRRCRMMGLDVPCPHHPGVLLGMLYNTQWLKPYYLCNPETGKWENS